MIKAIFFDFDGVLTTDKAGYITTNKALSKETGISSDKIAECILPYNSDLVLGKKTHKDIWSDFCSCVGQDIDYSVLNKAFDATPLNKEVYDIANSLKGKYKLGIITDNKKDRFDYLTEKFGLDSLFDNIVISSVVGYRKDSPEIFQEALNRAGYDADEAVFIDNKRSNLIVPDKMGFKTIFYDDGKNDHQGLVRELEDAGVSF